MKTTGLLTYCLRGIKEHCWTFWGFEETTVIIRASSCALYFMLICLQLLPGCEIPLISSLYIVCLCALSPPIRLVLDSFLSIPDLYCVTSLDLLLVPSEGVTEDKQNSHYNEQWQDVTHSATDQTPACCFYPCTHLHPSSWDRPFVWCHLQTPLISAEAISQLILLQQDGNTHFQFFKTWSNLIALPYFYQGWTVFCFSLAKSSDLCKSTETCPL